MREQAGEHAGTYYSRTFGPAGKQVQVIVLDTRYFRSPLAEAAQRSRRGKVRYVPSNAPDQDMLGDAQWDWLTQQMKADVDLNIIVSSIQALIVGKPWIESWSLLPAEQARLFRLLDQPGARPTVLISGDRHRGFLYRRSLPSGRVLLELTASSVNRGQNRQSRETDPSQIGPAYWPNNFGRLFIDWPAGRVIGEIRSADGEVVNSAELNFRPAIQ